MRSDPNGRIIMERPIAGGKRWYKGRDSGPMTQQANAKQRQSTTMATMTFPTIHRADIRDSPTITLSCHQTREVLPNDDMALHEDSGKRKVRSDEGDDCRSKDEDAVVCRAKRSKTDYTVAAAVEALLEETALPDGSHDKERALITAAQRGRESMVHCLLRVHGVEVTPRVIREMINDFDAIKLVYSLLGEDEKPSVVKPLRHAAIKGDDDLIAFLLAHDESDEAIDVVLSKLVAADKGDAVRTFLDHPNVNTDSSCKRVRFAHCLNEAVSKSRYDVIREIFGVCHMDDQDQALADAVDSHNEKLFLVVRKLYDSEMDIEAYANGVDDESTRTFLYGVARAEAARKRASSDSDDDQEEEEDSEVDDSDGDEDDSTTSISDVDGDDDDGGGYGRRQVITAPRAVRPFGAPCTFDEIASQ